jgi:hypothetical protein
MVNPRRLRHVAESMANTEERTLGSILCDSFSFSAVEEILCLDCVPPCNRE